MPRADGSLFIGRLGKDVRTKDLEKIFEPYGKLLRCEIKYGAEMAYAFVDYEDRRDAEDAIKYENGRDVLGSSIIVEWTKGTPRRGGPGGGEDDRGGRYGGGGGGRYGGGGGGGGGGYRDNYPRRRYSRSRSRSPPPRRPRSRSRSRDRRRSRST